MMSLTWHIDDFIISGADQEDEGEAGPWTEVHGDADTAAQLEQIAQSYVARASKEWRSIDTSEHLDGDDGIDSNLAGIIQNVYKSEYTQSDLWSFRVPVSPKSQIPNFNLFLSHPLGQQD